MMGEGDEDSEYDTDESDLAASWDSHDDLSSDEGQPMRQESLDCVRAESYSAAQSSGRGVRQRRVWLTVVVNVEGFSLPTV